MTTAAHARRHFGPTVLADEVGLKQWQFERAHKAGMLPEPGHSRGWRPEQVDEVRAAVPSIVERFGAERPVGAAKCAARLGQRLDLAVDRSDIEALALAGQLLVAEVYESDDGRKHDLFAAAAIDALSLEQVTAVLTARAQWTAPSVSFDDACTRLGWDWRELKSILDERQIARERFGRLRREDVDALADDAALCAQVLADRLLTADRAAERMDMERRHFKIAADAGLITPADHWEKRVGRRRTVSVPLYRTGDVDALLQHTDIDWNEVRATRKGDRSPLLDLVGRRPQTRAKLIRRFLRSFGAEHGIEMWGWYLPVPNKWEIDWERVEGGPSKDDVLAAIKAHPALRRLRKDLRLHSDVGAAIRFARTVLEPGHAVIVDTETTDLFGAVCEIAVIDASSGKMLLDTLVNPGVPIQATAQAIHGITDDAVTAPGVPDWPTVYRRLLRVTNGRVLLAYNADYDRTVIASDCARHGITRTRLADEAHWADVMVPRSDHARSYRWLPNGGGHRALADVQQTRQHLLRMTAP